VELEDTFQSAESILSGRARPAKLKKRKGLLKRRSR
jgi:hypothetical protein